MTCKKIISRTADVISLSLFLCAFYPALAIALWRYNRSQDKSKR